MSIEGMSYKDQRNRKENLDENIPEEAKNIAIEKIKKQLSGTKQKETQKQIHQFFADSVSSDNEYFILEGVNEDGKVVTRKIFKSDKIPQDKSGGRESGK